MKAQTKLPAAQSGMTLVELVVVLGILAAVAGTALVAVDGLSDRARVDDSARKLQQISQAVAGDGQSASRFVNDMGRLPDVVDTAGGMALSELWSDARSVGEVTSHAFTPVIGGVSFSQQTFPVNYGWKGPYIDAPQGKLYTGFGEEFQIRTSSTGSWHTPGGGMESGIFAVRCLGRDGVAGATSEWQDLDQATGEFGARASASLTVRILVRGREVADKAAWTAPVTISPRTSATEVRTYAAGEVLVLPGGHVFRCRSNATLSGAITAPTWDTTMPGAVTAVTDAAATKVEWEYLGGACEYVSAVTAVLFEPDTTNAPAAVGETAQTVSSGAVQNITLSGITPGHRHLCVYAALVGAGPVVANAFSSGIQSLEITPGDNLVTVLLTTPLN